MEGVEWSRPVSFFSGLLSSAMSLDGPTVLQLVVFLRSDCLYLQYQYSRHESSSLFHHND